MSILREMNLCNLEFSRVWLCFIVRYLSFCVRVESQVSSNILFLITQQTENSWGEISKSKFKVLNFKGNKERIIPY